MLSILLTADQREARYPPAPCLAPNRRLALLPFALFVELLGSGASWVPRLGLAAAISLSSCLLPLKEARSAATSQSAGLGDWLATHFR
jgi:hypothetical protein